MRTLLKVLAVTFTALAMSAGMAHLFALPNKIDLPAREYFEVQQIYRGWSLAGIALIAALLLNLATTVVLARARHRWHQAGVAVLCIGLSLVVFFLFTEPANRATDSWMQIPDNWRVLRDRWEYSHAFNACLDLLALLAITSAVVRHEPDPPHSRVEMA